MIWENRKRCTAFGSRQLPQDSTLALQLSGQLF
jgi:hypothetical protein